MPKSASKPSVFALPKLDLSRLLKRYMTAKTGRIRMSNFQTRERSTLGSMKTLAYPLRASVSETEMEAALSSAETFSGSMMTLDDTKIKLLNDNFKLLVISNEQKKCCSDKKIE